MSRYEDWSAATLSAFSPVQDSFAACFVERLWQVGTMHHSVSAPPSPRHHSTVPPWASRPPGIERSAARPQPAPFLGDDLALKASQCTAELHELLAMVQQMQTTSKKRQLRP
jgi:hypothetical protein